MQLLVVVLLQLYLTARFTVSATETSERKIWTTCNSNNSCSCGDSLSGVVTCSGENILIQPCYCMYYDQTENITVIGNCMLTCYYIHSGNYGNYHFPVKWYSEQNASSLNEDMCSSLISYVVTNREGRFCGRCKERFGLAAYSYHYTSCISCTDYGYKNWLRYFAVALLPLTLFYFIIVTLRINITTSRLNGIVFVLQSIGSPLQIRAIDGYLSTRANNNPKIYVAIPIVTDLLGVVNLDFFRDVYPYFCLHPKLNILHMLSLDFIVVLYPFVLILLTYLLIIMYDRNYRVVVWAWKPFKCCLKYYQRQFDVRSSLIETFATFILLSNVKILAVCFDVLAWTTVYVSTGMKQSKHLFYYDANIEYFGPEHLPFALLAFLIGFIFVFLPFLLLVVYPCRCFQRCLNFLGWRCQALHIFMDAFQGSYKTEPYDLRYFSAYYLLVRFILLFSMEEIASILYIPVMSVLMILFTVVFAAFQPYKNRSHNKIDIISMLLLQPKEKKRYCDWSH